MIKTLKVVYREINSNEELVFDIKKFNPLEVEYSKGVNCPYDSLQVSTLKGVSEMIVVELVNIDVWNKKIRLRITELPLEPSDNRNQEELLIQFGDINNQSIHSAENLLIHYTNENQTFTNIVDSIFIAGKMFYNVIETNGNNSGFSEPFDPPLNIKYTKSEGIIYIKDNVHNKEYVYDRVE